EYDHLKRRIYREVCRRILVSIKDRSHTGEALRFGDGVVRFAYPGVLIESMDLEELAAWLAIRNSRSLHPCPQCLVHHDDLDRITCTFPARTTEGMIKVVRVAPKSSATACNEYLKKYGLHDFEHFLWEFKNSDTYKAASLDKLHVFDGGDWGRHIWPVIKKDLQNNNQASDRLQRLDALVAEYELICIDINDEFGKDFHFLKQHMLSHATTDIRAKGTTRNTTTRVGEGFQQEVSGMYQKTNGKHAEHQITVLDEKEETMAQLDMKVDAWRRKQESSEDGELLTPVHGTSGSPPLFPQYRATPGRQHRVSKLRHAVARIYCPLSPCHLPPLVRNMLNGIQIVECKTLYIDFQSRVDWKQGRDILRCNPMFHGRPRYDSVTYSADRDESAMGRLKFLFRCQLPSKETIDLALVRPYRRSSWHPPTRTDCPIREWAPARAGQYKTAFIALEHITRGCLLSPIFGASREVFYVMDCVDADMFLRLHDID
ncbi:hypothetical protein FB45DRAFT_765753, partial [Roridomyces roridus]